MTHIRPPADCGEMADVLRHIRKVADDGWLAVADRVTTWLAYERDLTRYAIDSKLKAERERAIEEAAQCCDVLGENSRALPAFNTMAGWCAHAIRALKVMP